MIDHVINHFADDTKQHELLKPQFDGSMHYGSQTGLNFHYQSINDFAQISMSPDTRTSAPFYPLVDAKFKDVEHAMSLLSSSWALDKKIVLTSTNLDSAALNVLFQYHKVANGVRNAGMGIFYDAVPDSPFKAWNQSYSNFESMRRWEFREWFSIAWKGIVKDWAIGSKSDPTWLVLDNGEFIDQLPDHMRLIFAHCDLPWPQGLDQWLHDYRDSQQYIIEEFALIDKICNNIQNQQNFCWNELNVIAESLIQSKLRDLGYEIRCQDLDQFPTNVATLSNLLYPVEAI